MQIFFLINNKSGIPIKS